VPVTDWQDQRVRLANLPTPLHEMPRLRKALGGPARCPTLLIKRDDLTAVALGGNKARKLEFLIADALDQDATVVVTTGAVQSNHARMTAAAARSSGLDVVLVLTAEGDSPPLQGNLLLDRLFNATIHYVPPPADPMLATSDVEEAKVAEVMEDLRRRGERPYLIPVGGSSGVGVLGYVSGTKAFDAPYQVYGVAVSGGESFKRDRALRIANEAASRAGLATRVTQHDLLTDQNHIGEGYGIPTEECLEAIRLVAEREGILLDPVYTAKAMAGLIHHVRRGEFDPSSSVVFLHTGGVPALFAHASAFG
jgi:1-aminocyclopropane-1-carboxylate deaminase/D-cysteine desulfhydrase-like pyridoxal-dependent ACC family enzyme